MSKHSSTDECPGIAAARRRRSVVATMIATCMLFGLDHSMTSVALPSIRDSLSLRNEELSWVVSTYVIAFMVISPAVRWLCCRFGRRAVFGTSLAILAAADALCASATSFHMMIALRLVQGATMGVVFPLTFSNLLDEYEPDQHPRIIALWTTASWIGPVIGTILAGILVYRYEWPGVFAFHAAICAVLWAGSVKWMRRVEHRPNEKLDVVGLSTIALAVFALQLMLVRGLADIGKLFSGVLPCVFVASGLVFALNLRRGHDSIVNPGLFCDRNFSYSSILLLLLGFEIFAVNFVIPLVLADVFGADPFQISLLSAPRLIGTAFGAALAGKLNRQLGSENLAVGSFALISIGSALMLSIVSPTEPVTLMLVAGALYGVGVGIASTTLGIIAFATLPPEWRDEGAALRQLLRMIGGTLGISLMAAIANVPASGGANNYFSVFVLTTALAFLALTIVTLRRIRAWDRRDVSGTTSAATSMKRGRR